MKNSFDKFKEDQDKRDNETSTQELDNSVDKYLKEHIQSEEDSLDRLWGASPHDHDEQTQEDSGAVKRRQDFSEKKKPVKYYASLIRWVIIVMLVIFYFIETF